MFLILSILPAGRRDPVETTAQQFEPDQIARGEAMPGDAHADRWHRTLLGEFEYEVATAIEPPADPRQSVPCTVITDDGRRARRSS